jgi:hypothetical protein
VSGPSPEGLRKLAGDNIPGTAIEKYRALARAPGFRLARTQGLSLKTA